MATMPNVCIAKTDNHCSPVIRFPADNVAFIEEDPTPGRTTIWFRSQCDAITVNGGVEYWTKAIWPDSKVVDGSKLGDAVPT